MLEFEDVILNPPERKKNIPFDKWISYYSNPIYQPIFNSLNSGFKIMEEIYEEYPQEEKKKAKSTIYRYIKELIQEELVIKVGRRIITGQSASQTLFGRSSYLFIPENPIKTVWFSDDGLEPAFIVGKLLQGHFDDHYPDNKHLLEYVRTLETEFENIGTQLFETILEKDIHSFGSKNSAIYKVNSLSGDAGIVFFNLIDWLSWYLIDKAYLDVVPSLNAIYTLKTEEKQPPFERCDCKVLIPKVNNELKKDFQNIISYKQKNIVVVPSRVIPKFHSDLNYKAIIRILQNNAPLTVQEIHSIHYKTMMKIANSKKHNKKITDSELIELKTNIKPKAENTIYRFIQELIDIGLVVEAGRRITTNQAFTQILYTHVAKNSVFLENIDEFWIYEEWSQVIEVMASILPYLLHKKLQSKDKFRELVTLIEKTRLEQINQILEENQNPQVIEQMQGVYSTYNASIRIIGIIEWFYIRAEESQPLKNHLLSCFN